MVCVKAEDTSGQEEKGVTALVWIISISLRPRLLCCVPESAVCAQCQRPITAGKPLCWHCGAGDMRQ
jgi:hypothetical protein